MRTGFDVRSTLAPASRRNGEQSITAPVITYEPKPAYTAEAAQAHVHGEVVVEVNLKASGQAVAIRIVSELGYGLDEEALRVVAGLRFRSATRDGVAVDRVTHVHVLFQLG